MVGLKLKCCQPLRMNFGGLLFVEHVSLRVSPCMFHADYGRNAAFNLEVSVWRPSRYCAQMNSQPIPICERFPLFNTLPKLIVIYSRVERRSSIVEMPR